MTVPWARERMCILLSLGEIFCNCCLGQVSWQCSSGFLYLIFCVLVLALTEKWILKYPTIVVDLLISFLGSVSLCSTHFQFLLLSADSSRISKPSWWINTFILMKIYLWCYCLFWSLLSVSHINSHFLILSAHMSWPFSFCKWVYVFIVEVHFL